MQFIFSKYKAMNGNNHSIYDEMRQVGKHCMNDGFEFLLFLFITKFQPKIDQFQSNM